MECQELFIKDEPRDLDIEHKGKTYKFKVKDVSWSVRNKILGACTKVDRQGNPSFDLDKYMRDMLKAMLVEAPWGATTDTVLVRLDPEFGAMLEKIVPMAYKEEGIDFFEPGPESS